MRIVIDHRTVPPCMELENPRAFDSLSVSLRIPHHAWLDRRTLVHLAGEAVDAPWIEKLDEMINYAADKGWVDEDGRIRAHLSMPGDGET